METKDYLEYLVRDIHTTVVSTVDDKGLPFTSAIDMMDYSDNSIFLLQRERFFIRG